jgi:hypothetical protein
MDALLIDCCLAATSQLEFCVVNGKAFFTLLAFKVQIFLLRNLVAWKHGRCASIYEIFRKLLSHTTDLRPLPTSLPSLTQPPLLSPPLVTRSMREPD